MLRPTARRLLTIGAILAFASLGAATIDTDDSPPSQSTEGVQPAANPGPSPEHPGKALLDDLERHLDADDPYGDGPQARAIATGVKEWLEDRDAVAVRVFPSIHGAPRRIVVIIKFPDLRDVDNDQREGYIEDVFDELDEEFDGMVHTEIAVGIRGHLMYGAVGYREPEGITPEIRSGYVVDAIRLHSVLAPRSDGR